MTCPGMVSRCQLKEVVVAQETSQATQAPQRPNEMLVH